MDKKAKKHAPGGHSGRAPRAGAESPLAGGAAGERPALPGDDRITRRGKTIIVVGLAAILAGFIVLTRADPMGRNWASHISPFLILGGYALIGMGIFTPDPEP